MIKTYLYDDETKEMVTNLDLGDVHEKLRNPDNLLWIDLYDVHGQELAQIAKLFDFHPLAIEDCLHDSPRAKMDDYEEATATLRLNADLNKKLKLGLSLNASQRSSSNY